MSKVSRLAITFQDFAYEFGTLHSSPPLAKLNSTYYPVRYGENLRTLEFNPKQVELLNEINRSVNQRRFSFFYRALNTALQSLPYTTTSYNRLGVKYIGERHTLDHQKFLKTCTAAKAFLKTAIVELYKKDPNK